MSFQLLQLDLLEKLLLEWFNKLEGKLDKILEFYKEPISLIIKPVLEFQQEHH